MAFLPQAPKAAGVAEYIVLAEAVVQDGIHPTGQEDPHIPIASATEALPVLVATRVPAIATAVSRPLIQWGVGIPLRPSHRRGSSSRPPVPDSAAQAEFVNGPRWLQSGFRRGSGTKSYAKKVNPPSV